MSLIFFSVFQLPSIGANVSTLNEEHIKILYDSLTGDATMSFTNLLQLIRGLKVNIGEVILLM